MKLLAHRAGFAVAPPVNRSADKPVDSPVYKFTDVDVFIP
jgi:hypothetical protein